MNEIIPDNHTDKTAEEFGLVLSKMVATWARLANRKIIGELSGSDGGAFLSCSLGLEHVLKHWLESQGLQYQKLRQDGLNFFSSD